jgi:hypothetical protein
LDDENSQTATGRQKRSAADTEGKSAINCDRCGSTAETQWIVQAETPAGRYLRLSDGETTELCDACMGEVVENIGDEDENARNESIQGGENER